MADIATSTAGYRLVHTFELLEHILLFVHDGDLSETTNAKTLLLSQAVCRAFRDTISNSTAIQTALCFLPHPDFFPPDTDGFDIFRPTEQLDRTRTNPLLRRSCRIATPEGYRFELKYYPYTARGASVSFLFNSVLALPDVGGISGSWKRMVITHEETVMRCITITWGPVPDCYWTEGNEEKGKTVGELLEIVLESYRSEMCDEEEVEED